MPPATPSSNTVPPVSWPKKVSKQDIKEGSKDPNLTSCTIGKGGTEYPTCVSFGTNGFQGRQQVSIFIPPGAKNFEATLGLSRDGDTGSVKTEILLDDQLQTSYVVDYYDQTRISVPVSGASVITVSVEVVAGGTKVPSNKAIVYGDARFTD